MWRGIPATQLMKHSRILALLSVSFACVALNFWLITTRHYRLPIFVFVAAIILIAIVLPKLPPPTKAPKEIKNNLLKASASVRRLGFLYILGTAMAIVGLFSGEFKDLPIWGIVAMFAWGGFLIWAAFRGAKWYKDKATLLRQSDHEETK
ncbi:MAG TPA: hypothetical protein VMU61_09060 [Candidatus Aquilonibacter sp.]|nr:hypothetical protein [Candidatus Aquilonibacter sp.]